MALVMARAQLAPTSEEGTSPPSDAAAVPTQGPDALWVGLGYLLLIVGLVLGWALWKLIDPKPLVAAAGFSIFAPLYILAQGIERLIEPFSKFFGSAGGTTKEQAEDGRNAAFAAWKQGTATSTQAAAAQALVNQIRRNSAVFAWGLASLLGMIASGCFGIFLLAACGFDVPAFWDIALTGLAIGSGTKPLHDLIGNIQKAANEKADPPEVVTAE
jgi:hypothetical protein